MLGYAHLCYWWMDDEWVGGWVDDEWVGGWTDGWMDEWHKAAVWNVKKVKGSGNFAPVLSWIFIGFPNIIILDFESAL